MSFSKKIIENIVNKLIKGKDYREEVINTINVEFFDFTIEFFKQILEAKLNNREIDLQWYKRTFINNEELKSEDIANFAGTNKKTITNIFGSAKRDIVIDISNKNFQYLENIVTSLEETKTDEDLQISIKISYNKVYVELSLVESLLVINALATKKISIRGSAWSSIGKKVEKPLMIKLCEICNVNTKYMSKEIFVKDKDLNFDREVDFKLYSRNQKNVYRVEIKLMGRGNPESADAVIARDTNIFVADTLSCQNKNQLTSLNIEFLELKNNKNIKEDFKKILKKLDIPFS